MLKLVHATITAKGNTMGLFSLKPVKISPATALLIAESILVSTNNNKFLSLKEHEH